MDIEVNGDSDVADTQLDGADSIELPERIACVLGPERSRQERPFVRRLGPPPAQI